MDSRLYARAATLMEAEVDGEIVALDREGGDVLGFNSTASEVWRLLDKPRSLGEICAAMLERYEVPADLCEQEVSALLDQLVAMRLIAVTPATDD